MFAANAHRDELLSSFRIALVMLLEEDVNTPANIKDYFNNIVAQAKCLIEDSCAHDEHLFPEAINLAFRAKRTAHFRDRLYEIDVFDNVDPGVAHQVLNFIDAHAD